MVSSAWRRSWRMRASHSSRSMAGSRRASVVFHQVVVGAGFMAATANHRSIQETMMNGMSTPFLGTLQRLQAVEVRHGIVGDDQIPGVAGSARHPVPRASPPFELGARSHNAAQLARHSSASASESSTIQDAQRVVIGSAFWQPSFSISKVRVAAPPPMNWLKSTGLRMWLLAPSR